MIQYCNNLRFLCLLLPAIVFPVAAESSSVPVVESVLQHQFPNNPKALAKTTDALFQEYEKSKNVTALIFYSYGMLKQAGYFSAVNDIINASEYVKAGFFYLDEAVDSNESNLRVLYLRARLDAYLPSDLGRCVITVMDTELLLKEKDKFSKNITEHINNMRYRALYSCKKYDQANKLVTDMKANNPNVIIANTVGDSPSWDIDEVSQIILPLVKGD